MSKNKNIIAWGLQIVAGVLFILASSGKLTSGTEVITMFDNWGYPHGFYLVIGILELVGGLLLFYPATSGYSSILLVAVMIGATATHIIHNEGMVVLKPLVHMILLVGVFYFRFFLDFKNDDKEVFPLSET